VDKHSEADYAYVHFTLDFPPSLDGSNIYVFGMLTDWKLNDRNRMKYNSDKGLYELIMLLKQGWYDYNYVIAGPSGSSDEYRIEGSHNETGNFYSFFIYSKETGSDFTRLIGHDAVQFP